MSVVAPVVWPLLMGALLMALWRHGRFQRVLAVAGSAFHVLFAGQLLAEVSRVGHVAVNLGDWPAPFGIAFVADRTAAALVFVSAAVGLFLAIYALSGVDQRREAFGYHPLAQVLMGGVCGSFLTADFFNLFVWFEVMLMASFVLMALGGERRQMEGAIQYVALNLIASTTFLVGVGLLYGTIGTVNMADVAVRLPQAESPALAGVACALLAFSFGVKAAAFPVYVWLPASYHTPPTVVTALFAGLLTKVGVYALLRASTLVFAPSAPFLMPVLMVVGCLTMVLGVFGAAAQGDFRRVLSFHIVSQIGYMIVGIALMTTSALAAALLFVIHNILAKTNLFLIGGIARRYCHTEQLKQMGGLYARHPYLAFLFLISAMSLAGIPPLSGFWAKLFLVRGGLEAEAYWPVGAALAVGLLTLFSMLKLWNEAFWKPAPDGLPDEPQEAMGRLRFRYLPVAGLALAIVAFGVAAGPLWDFAMAAAADLVDPTAYIDAVLGARP